MDKKKFPLWSKAVAAVFLCFLAYAIFTTVTGIPHTLRDDPRWLEWHVEARSVEEAEALFGDGLLLRQFAESGCRNVRYSLELTDDGSTIEDRDKWVMLDAVCYGDGVFSTLKVYFDGLPHAVRRAFEADTITETGSVVIDGTTVDYALDAWGVYPGVPNILMALFRYGGNDFSFSCDCTGLISDARDEAQAREGIQVAWDALHYLLSSHAPPAP